MRAPGGALTTYYYGRGRPRCSRSSAAGSASTSPPTRSARPKVVADAAGDDRQDARLRRVRQAHAGRRDAPGFDLPIGFAGGIEDPLTGLVRFGLRDYDPAAGRWTARDPILQAGGLNIYAYVNSDPVGHRDPSGLRGRLASGLRHSRSATSSATATRRHRGGRRQLDRQRQRDRRGRREARRRHGQGRDGPGGRRRRRSRSRRRSTSRPTPSRRPGCSSAA